jgi:hypothetical protein
MANGIAQQDSFSMDQFVEVRLSSFLFSPYLRTLLIKGEGAFSRVDSIAFLNLKAQRCSLFRNELIFLTFPIKYSFKF